MKQLIFFSLFTLISFNSFSKDTKSLPRQKITLEGSLKADAPKALTFQNIIDVAAPSTIKIFDPYNKNIETTFTGYYLSEIVKKYGPADFKILRIGAIDGYKVDIPKADITKSELFVAYKDEHGYLTVDRMGPVRIIAPVKGIINKDLLLKIGVYWVWQVKTLEFVK